MSKNDDMCQHISDMLAELDADPRKGFTNDELRAVLGSEKMVECIAETRRLEREQRAILLTDGYDYWGKNEPALLAYEELRNTAKSEWQAIQSHMETALRHKAALKPGEWEKENTGGHSYASKWRSWEKQLPAWIAALHKAYNGLSERDKLFLSKPVPNPVSPVQFPRPEVATNGYFYPRRRAQQVAQKHFLEMELARLEAAR